jgi:hypothetical protein
LLEQFNYLLAASKPEDEVEMREKRKVGNDLSYHNCMLFRLLPLLHLGAEENFCHSRSFERTKAQKDARAINIVRGHQLALKNSFFLCLCRCTPSAFMLNYLNIIRSQIERETYKGSIHSLRHT